MPGPLGEPAGRRAHHLPRSHKYHGLSLLGGDETRGTLEGWH